MFLTIHLSNGLFFFFRDRLRVPRPHAQFLVGPSARAALHAKRNSSLSADICNHDCNVEGAGHGGDEEGAI